MPSTIQSTNCYIKNSLYRLAIVVDDDNQQQSPKVHSPVNSSSVQATDILSDDIDPALTRLSFKSLNQKKNSLLLKDIMISRILSVQQGPLVKRRRKRNSRIDVTTNDNYTVVTPSSKQSRVASAVTLDTVVSIYDTIQPDEIASQADLPAFYPTETVADMEVTSAIRTMIKISYVDVSDSIRWIVKRIELEVDSEEQANELYVTLNMYLSLLQQRPRRLLVFINPFGGKGQARRIFEKKSLPLFKEANIAVKAVFTKSAGQAKEHIMKENLNDYDGIICVGGDGMFAELCNGLLLRTTSEANLDIDDPEVNIVPAKLRIGIIPAGSTDAVVYGTTGFNDPITSTLQIIVGESLSIDLATVHNEKGFVRFMAAMLGYGFFGDIIKLSDKWRCLGPLRYDVAGAYQFLRNRSYDCEVTVTPAKYDSSQANYNTINSSANIANDRAELHHAADLQQPWTEDGSKPNQNHQADHKLRVLEKVVKPALVFCKKNCEKCASRLKNNPPKPDVVSEVRREGKYTTINCLNMPCRSAKSKFGIAPFVHLGDGSFDLVVVKGSSRTKFLRFLWRIAHDGRSLEDLPNVERFTGNDVVISPLHSDRQERGNWQIDGELVQGNEMRVRVHCQVLNLFASGIQIDKVEEYIPKKKESRLRNLCPCLRRRKEKG